MAVEPRLRWLSLAYASTAAAAAGLALAPPGTPAWQALIPALLWCVAAAAMLWQLCKRGAWRVPAWLATIGWAALLFAPMALEPIRRNLAGDGATSELLLLAGLRNFALGMALTSALHRLRTSGMASLFVALFSAGLADGPALVAVMALHAGLACVWFAETHWATLKIPGRANGARPTGVLLGMAVGLAGMVAFIDAGPRRTAALLGEFFDSSGGTSKSDPFARGGVGDGEDLVRTKDKATSAAPIDTEVMVESEQPALDDVATEERGKPLDKPKKKDQQNQAQARGMLKEKPEDSKAETQKAGREFTTQRQLPRPPRNLQGTEASGDLYYQGPAPAHLALRSWIGFDGVAWQEETRKAFGESIAAGEDKWLARVATDTRTKELGPEAGCRVKLVKIKTAVFPLPAHVRRFKVNNAEYAPRLFAVPAAGRLGVPTDDPDAHAPFGTVIDAEFASERHEWLRTAEASYIGIPGEYFAAPPNAARLKALAEEWTRGAAKGWGQAEAIAARLQRDYALDPNHRHPPDCQDTVSDFLFVSKQGRDYDFAGAAVALLRSLGIPARLAAGYYVRPERWDERTKQYLVQRADFHLWAEVGFAKLGWCTLEPTPGYETMPPQYGLGERILLAARAAGRWLVARWWLWLALGALGGWAWRRRAALRRTWAELRWRVRMLGARRDPRAAALATVKLLDDRAAAAREPRPPHRTWREHHAPRVPPAAANDLRELLELADWAAFAPPQAPPPAADIPARCRAAAGRLAESTPRSLPA